MSPRKKYDPPIETKPNSQPKSPVNWRPEHWINDDCSVKECSDGYIRYEYRGYETVARCPRCDRTKDQHGMVATGIPIYTGLVTFRNQQEMDERRTFRVELIENHAYRRGRAREFFEDMHKHIELMMKSRETTEQTKRDTKKEAIT